MDNPIETARELATHAADIKHLQDDMDKLVEDMEAVKKSLDEIQRLLSINQGRDRTIGTILTVGSGLVGGAIVWVLDRVFK